MVNMFISNRAFKCKYELFTVRSLKRKSKKQLKTTVNLFRMLIKFLELFEVIKRPVFDFDTSGLDSRLSKFGIFTFRLFFAFPGSFGVFYLFDFFQIFRACMKLERAVEKIVKLKSLRCDTRHAIESTTVVVLLTK